MNELPGGPSIAEMELFKIFTTNPFSFLKECYEKYGDMFTIKLGTFGVTDYETTGNWVFLCNSDHIKTLFKTKSDVIQAGPANDIQFQQLLPKQAMVIMDGAEHIDRRKMLSSSVQSKEKIRQLTPAIVQIVRDEISAFPADQAFPLSPAFRRISGEAMRCLIFGDVGKEEVTCINAKLSEFGDPAYSHAEKISLVEESANSLNKIIAEYKSCPHQAGEEQNNIFSVLMHGYTKDKTLDEKDVRDETITLLLGGNDTSATTMSWAMTWIFSLPEVMKKVLQELRHVFADHAPTAEDFEKLPYLDAVIKESSRISAMFFTTSARILVQPMELGGYQLPPGTMIVSCPYIVHTRPDYYPEPMEFKPERFLDTNADPSQWLPFGGGIRRCLGMAFALHEMKVVIATLLHECKFEGVDISTEAELQGGFFAPKGSVTVKFAG
jgi:unspecific monooxygenase